MWEMTEKKVRTKKLINREKRKEGKEGIVGAVRGRRVNQN